MLITGDLDSSDPIVRTGISGLQFLAAGSPEICGPSAGCAGLRNGRVSATFTHGSRIPHDGKKTVSSFESEEDGNYVADSERSCAEYRQLSAHVT